MAALNMHALERQIEDSMAAARLPGLALAVLAEGRLIYARGFGVTSTAQGGLPVTPHTLFRIGSTTKALTGTAALRLVQAGLLHLDRPVCELLPWLSLSEPSHTAQVTLRMLLSHTAGLPTWSDPQGRREPAGLGETLRQTLPQAPLKAPPGRLYSYSNLGANLVGHLLETAAGQPYASLMQQWVFDPLEMPYTTFDPLAALTYPTALSHRLDEHGLPQPERRFAENTAEHPAGFAISNLLDMANFAQVHLNQGQFAGQPFLSPASIAEMHTPQADLYSLDQAGYGLLLQISHYKGLQRVGHNGGINAYGSRFVLLPEAGAGVILFFNRAPEFWARADALVNGIFDELLHLPAETPPPSPCPPDRSLWPAFCGAYLSNFTGLAEISVRDNGLLLRLNGEPVPLQALRRDLYFGVRPGGGWLTVGFPLEAEGPCRYAIVQGAPCQRFERDLAYLPPAASLAAHAGTYTGEYGEVTVFAREGVLYLYSRERGQETTCLPLEKSRFACPWGLAHFFQDESGAAFLKIANYAPLKRVNLAGAPNL
jgi:CubicO group peptidase (beta-lactamase class C family)